MHPNSNPEFKEELKKQIIPSNQGIQNIQVKGENIGYYANISITSNYETYLYTVSITSSFHNNLPV